MWYRCPESLGETAAPESAYVTRSPTGLICTITSMRSSYSHSSNSPCSTAFIPLGSPPDISNLNSTFSEFARYSSIHHTRTVGDTVIPQSSRSARSYYYSHRSITGRPGTITGLENLQTRLPRLSFHLHLYFPLCTSSPKSAPLVAVVLMSRWRIRWRCSCQGGGEFVIALLAPQRYISGGLESMCRGIHSIRTY